MIGVSPDEPEALKKFAGKYDLDFTLLADPDHAVAEAYGAWGEKSMYGKKYMGDAALDLHHRRRRQDRPGLPEGPAEKARRPLVLKALAELADGHARQRRHPVPCRAV